ncbi:hypothetical protein L9G15_05015 [Shewanella sp. A3A]|nr:hypothetical protein [Shewanella ferrihydritica]
MHTSTSRHLLAALLLGSMYCTSSLAVAAPSTELIAEYNQAAAGKGDMSAVLAKLTELKAQQGADPLTLVYWGSAKTMSASNEFWPWRKYQTAEDGLSAIDKAVQLLTTSSSDERRLGLDATSLTRAIAAVTYTAVPKMFNRFERGYDLFITLLESPQFQAVPAQYTGWIYQRAISTAIKADDLAQAEQWQQQLARFAPSAPLTQATAAMIANTHKGA